MDKATLVADDIREGRELLEALDREGVPVKAALWFYTSETGRWRLLLATPIVDEKGPKEAYALIRQVMSKKGSQLGAELLQISLVSPGDALIQLLKGAVSAREGAEVRFRETVINGVFIEDAYIYMLQ